MTTAKALVVDDDEGILRVLAAYLKSNDEYEVLTTTSSQDALEIVKNTPIDLLISDIMMPGKDGYKICDEIKTKVSSDIPVIVFTAQKLEKDIMDEVHKYYGADDYLFKPFEIEELLEKIERLLEKK